MTKCKQCRKEFQPRQPHHRLCYDCWLQDQGQPKPYHPRMKWLDLDNLIPWAILVGILLLLLWLLQPLFGQ